MIEYELFLHDQVIEFIKQQRGRNRRQLRGFLIGLTQNPFLPPEYVFEDKKHRVLYRNSVGAFVVSWIRDDPMRELKIVRISRAQGA